MTSAEENAESSHYVCDETIEERYFGAGLICIEAHFREAPLMGPKTTARIKTLVDSTLDKTQSNATARNTLAKNVGIWLSLARTLHFAITSIANRSLGPPPSGSDSERRITPHESNALIASNYHSLQEDLQFVIKLMHIARNLLVTSEPEIPQDLCAAVHFDQDVYQIILLCINVASKGSDSEMLDDTSQSHLIEINELFKRLLVVSLQQAHNWVAKHDRNKMSFWHEVLFDYDSSALSQLGTVRSSFCASDVPAIPDGLRPEFARVQTRQWLQTHSKLHHEARRLLYTFAQNNKRVEPGGLLGASSHLYRNWVEDPSKDSPTDKSRSFESEPSHRVSEEVENWYLRHQAVRYIAPHMTTVDNVKIQIESCKASRMSRCLANTRSNPTPAPVPPSTPAPAPASTPAPASVLAPAPSPVPAPPRTTASAESSTDVGSEYADDYVEDDLEEDEGLLAGILTEIPNILDPKQIEALHLIVKSCIVGMDGLNPTLNTRELQLARCRMFLALDCGKSLLREMLVFIAVWEMEEAALIYKLTSEIVDAIHQATLIPYAWQNLRTPKDIMSPAQTVLMRMIYLIMKNKSEAYHGQPGENERYIKSREFTNDVILIHFLFHIFRWEVVPECLALMHLQTQVRENKMDASHFPIDMWDMDRAKEGLAVFLDLIMIVAEIPEMRNSLIEWEAIFDLVSLLNGLDAAVVKKPLVSLPNRSRGSDTTPSVDRPYTDANGNPHSLMQEPAYKFPWGGLKVQIFTIMAHLLQPPPGRSSPGNAVVQQQIVRNNGIVPLLNSCAYDDHNPFAKERVTVCLKWLLDGCEAANNFFRELISLAPPMNGANGASAGVGAGTGSGGVPHGPAPPPPPAAGGATTAAGNASRGGDPVVGAPGVPEATRIRIDGVDGEFHAEIRKKGKGKAQARYRDTERGMAAMNLNSNGNTDMENDF
ncbi:hypothetical protein TD95_004389, partial [Thielaviopsis punctulata]